jgi:asparagine synthase (glutamine-hydrolysing)
MNIECVGSRTKIERVAEDPLDRLHGFHPCKNIRPRLQTPDRVQDLRIANRLNFPHKDSQAHELHMALFGFLGPLLDTSTLDAMRLHGEKFCGRVEPQVSRRHTDFCAACWAPRFAEDARAFVAVQGEPLWFDDSTCEHSVAEPAAILEAYRRSGSDLLTSLRGRFALAIVDGEARRALLAIDPIGIERLTYAVRDQQLVFSVSAHAVASSPNVNAPVSNQALFDYMLLHVVPGPDTAFTGVRKLRAGTCLSFADGRVDVQRYWQPRFNEHAHASFSTLRDELKASLQEGVRSCRPDERTGAFLSGGLDSSSVAGVLSQVGPRPARTFSIGFGYPQYDELPYARIANARFGCEGHEYIVTGNDIADIFPRIGQTFDEPFGNSSALPVYCCARFAAENGIEHLLAGDGGDELFAGNSRYAEQLIFEHYLKVPAILRRALIEPVITHWPDPLAFWPIRKARGYVQKANTPLPRRLESWNVIYRSGPAEFLHPDFLGSVDPHAPLARMDEVWRSAPCQSTLNRMLYYDWQYTLADNDLRKVEAMSALARVRVSYPMLHPSVIAMSLRIPPQLKMPGTKLRHFYKRAMCDFLPQEIIHKKKHGFGLPFGLWLTQSAALRELIFGNLANLRARRIVRGQFLDRLLDLHGSDDASYYGVFLWVLAMLEQWLHDHALQPIRA